MIGDVLARLRLDAAERNAWVKAEKKRQRERLYNGGASGKSSTASGSTARSSALRGTLRGGTAARWAAATTARRRPHSREWRRRSAKPRRDRRGGRPGSGRSGTLARPSAAEPGSRRDRTGYGYGGGCAHAASAGVSASGARTVGSVRAIRPDPPGRLGDSRARSRRVRVGRRGRSPLGPAASLGWISARASSRGPTAAEAAASRAHGMAARAAAHEALMPSTGGGGVLRRGGRGACASDDARRREQLRYAIQHIRRGRWRGDDAPLDVRDDEFLSSFPLAARRRKKISPCASSGDAARRRPGARDSGDTSLAANSLNSVTPRSALTRTYR